MNAVYDKPASELALPHRRTVTVSVEWAGLTGDPLRAAENLARDKVKLWGFFAVCVQAVYRGDRVTIELFGERADVEKASKLFER